MSATTPCRVRLQRAKLAAIAPGSLCLLLDDVEDALLLFVLLIIDLTVFQGHKSGRVLETLRDLSSPCALVLHDGQQQRIAVREGVPGDLLLTEGDRVAADAVLLLCNDLLADKSLMAGKLAAVHKQAGTPDMAAHQSFVYARTVLVQDSGIGLVTATGKYSAIGQIGKALESACPGESPLRIQTGRLVRHPAILAGVLCLILVLA